MNLDSEKLKTVATVANDFEASAIVSALDAEGIRARAVGGYTAGFRARAPGGVAVIVAETDFERARQLLDAFRNGGADIDWSQVDVENPDDSA